LHFFKTLEQDMRTAKATAVVLVGWLSAITGAIAADEHSFALEVLWSTPLAAISLSRPAGTPYNPGPEPGSIFEAQAIDPDGRVVFLGSQIIAGKRVMVLFADPEHSPSDNAIILALKGAHPFNLHLVSRLVGSGPRPFTLAVGSSGEIWVGGGSNSYMDFASGDHRDAYLAKIDVTGKTLWEKAYGNGGWRQILSMASLTNGEVAVAGEDAGKGWLARIGADGSQLWERRLGIAKHNAVASLPGNRLVVAGFEATGSSSTGNYQDHITAWIVDGSGEILAQTRVRTAISTSAIGNYEHISVAATKDAIYVISSWDESFHTQPIEVSKLDLDGKLLWTTSLPNNNASAKITVFTSRGCSPTTLAINPRGDAQVACTLGGQIHVYQLEQSSGSYRESELSLPDCNNGYSATLFLAVRNDATMVLSGSQPELNTVDSCTWVGRLTEVH
jgi:outer membrane protein assembly factor BamB